MNKEFCIVDTCSLINCSRDLAGKKILERLNEVYSLALPEKVAEELTQLNDNRIRSLLDYARKFVKTDKDLVKDLSEYDKCMDIVKRWFDKRGISGQFTNLHPGEKHCMALALYLSRKERNSVILMTDDFDAIRNGLQRFVSSQQVGLVKSTADAVIHLYGLTSEIRESHVVGAINDYVRGNPFGWNAKGHFMRKLDQSCRNLGLGTCLSKCL